MTTCRKRAKGLSEPKEARGYPTQHPFFWMGKLSQPVAKLVLSSY